MKHIGVFIFLVAFFLLPSCSESVRESRLRNYWSDYDFSTNTAIENIQELENHFADYCELLSQVPEETATLSIKDFVSKLSKNELLFYVYYEMFCGGLYSIESPYRNEALFDVYLEAAMASGIFKGYEQERISDMARLSKLARPGDKIGDFEVFTLGRESVRFHELLNRCDLTLVLVIDPNCPYCLDMIDNIAKDKSVADMVEKENLQTVLLATLPDFGIMEQVSKDIPDNWLPYVAGTELDTIIDRHLSPSYYLIGNDAVVQRKASDIVPVF